MEKISIRGREYKVEKVIDGRYILSGKRGAKYGAIQNASGLLFLVDLHRTGMSLKGVSLSDSNGQLEVVRQ
jgi:hypothetical protein